VDSRGRFPPRLAAALLSAATLAACATNTTVANPVARLPARSADCQIRYFRGAQPEEPYEVITQVETHIKKNFFFGGTVQLEDEGYAELRKQACRLGGDAVIIDDYVESSAAEMTHIHVWASVIKLAP
jgi:hypothetical protein